MYHRGERHKRISCLLTCNKSPQTSLSMIPIVSAIDADTKANSLYSSLVLREMRLKPATYTAPPSSPAMKQGIRSVQSYLCVGACKYIKTSESVHTPVTRFPAPCLYFLFPFLPPALPPFPRTRTARPRSGRRRRGGGIEGRGGSRARSWRGG